MVDINRSRNTSKHWLKKFWHFLWEDDSAWSWLANVVVAFILIKFVVYPLLGLLLGTSYPLVAVVSESMEHGIDAGAICGYSLKAFPESFDNYWKLCGDWYENNGITKAQFAQFSFQNGFDKGDVILLWRANKRNIEVGDVLVFQGTKPQPIIHRVVKVWQENGQYFYHTKGDHNSASITGTLGETKIEESRVYGKGLIRVPYLGWVKILAVDAAKLVGIQIEK